MSNYDLLRRSLDEKNKLKEKMNSLEYELIHSQLLNLSANEIRYKKSEYCKTQKQNSQLDKEIKRLNEKINERKEPRWAF